MKNYVIIFFVLSFIVLSSCSKKKPKITRINYPEYYPLKPNNDSIIYKILKISDYDNFIELTKTINRVVCNDSIPKIEFRTNDTIKQIQLFNFCYLDFGCVLIRQRNVIEIHNDTIIKSGVIYPIDSLYYIMKKDFFNNGKDDNYCNNPKKLIIDISYNSEMKQLNGTLNKVTNYYSKLNVKNDLHIRLLEKIELEIVESDEIIKEADQIEF